MDVIRANNAGAGSGSYRTGSTTSESMKKRLVSIGKQPKASTHASSSSSSANKKKRTMVSELFDSLTPAAEYFAEGSRRRRAGPKNYNEHERVFDFNF